MNGTGTADAAMAQAIKVSGAVVQMEPAEFPRLIQRGHEVLVVQATGGVFRTNHPYLTCYKGLAFFTKSPGPPDLPESGEVIQAGKIWNPQ